VLASLDVVVPAYNEARTLEQSCARLREALDAALPGTRTRILVVTNGCTDGTVQAAHAAAARIRGLDVLEISTAGKGRAVKAGWESSRADVVAYTDLDQAAPASQLALLCAQLEDGYDLAVASRYHAQSRTRRTRGRAASGYAYRRLVAAALDLPVADTACGLKAARRSSLLPVLETVESASWFFDTELVARAHHSGLSVVEVPVTWTENPNSRLRVGRASWEMGRGVLRLRRELSGAPPVAASKAST
jgi:glycosyltransferase involved in cell wall biosynthesis